MHDTKVLKLIREKIKNNSIKPYVWSNEHEILKFDKPYSTTSMVCNQSFFDLPFFSFWMQKLNEVPRFHRKQWEMVYICQALYERGLLKDGIRGCVFGVGQEPLPALFISMGCKILATDLEAVSAKNKGWVSTKQHINNSLDTLNIRGLCNKDLFNNNIEYLDVDMNNIPDSISGFDFCWSTCAFEHLGSLKAGIEFVKNSLKTIKKGGISIHTTEYNISSNINTIEQDELSIYRKKDIEQLIDEVKNVGGYVFPIDYYIGNNVVDNFIDLPPYNKNNMHLKLKIGDYISTSIGIIIKKI